MRWLIRITAFFVVLSAIIFSSQLAMGQQKEHPFGAKDAFTLRLLVKETSKEEILREIQDISQNNHAVLVRPILNVETGGYDLAWFGAELPESRQISTGKDEIYWLSTTEPGKIFPAGDLGESPINGTYYLLPGASSEIGQELISWGEENGVQIQQEKLFIKPFLPVVVLFSTAIGHTVLALVALLLSLMIAWTISNSKAQSMHLLVGQSPQRIQLTYLRKGGRWCAEGNIVAVLVSVTYLALAGYQPQLLSFLLLAIQVSFFSLAICLIFLGAVLFLARPNLVHLSQRTIPYQKFKWIGAFARISVLALIVVIMPSTLSMAVNAYKYQQDQKIWENYRDLYNISPKNLHDSEVEDNQGIMENFIEKIHDNKKTYLAYGMKESFMLEDDMLDNYEDVVIVDYSWLERQGVDIEGNRDGFNLKQIKIDEFPVQLQYFLVGENGNSGQLSLIAKENKEIDEIFTYYAYEGEPLFVPGMDSAYGGKVHFYKKALLIVVDDPLGNLNSIGFIIPAMSSGNIFFSGNENLAEYAQQTGFDRYIFAIDSFAQLGLQVLEEYRQYFKYYLLSLVALGFALLFTSYQSAAVWASIYKKRIFTLRTSGQSYPKLIHSEIFKELGLVAVIMVFFALIRVLLTPHLALEIGTVILASLLVFSLTLYLNFLAHAKNSFTQVSQRK